MSAISNLPFELQQGEDLTLRIFIDKNMIEVFANDRQAAVAWHEYDPQDLQVSLFSKGGDLKVNECLRLADEVDLSRSWESEVSKNAQ